MLERIIAVTLEKAIADVKLREIITRSFETPGEIIEVMSSGIEMAGFITRTTDGTIVHSHNGITETVTLSADTNFR